MCSRMSSSLDKENGVTIPNIRLQLNQSNGICASLKQYKSGFTCSYKPSISVMRELLGSIR